MSDQHLRYYELCGVTKFIVQWQINRSILTFTLHSSQNEFLEHLRHCWLYDKRWIDKSQDNTLDMICNSNFWQSKMQSSVEVNDFSHNQYLQTSIKLVVLHTSAAKTNETRHIVKLCKIVQWKLVKETKRCEMQRKYKWIKSWQIWRLKTSYQVWTMADESDNNIIYYQQHATSSSITFHEPGDTNNAEI